MSRDRSRTSNQSQEATPMANRNPLRKLVATGLLLLGAAAQAADKPNILVIWGDDIGTWNISHNSRGMMGYQTPNIDRIAKEGLSFTDYYGQQSCTAGRAAFLGGNVPIRTGMTKVGLPGAKEGWQKTDVTIATVMKSLGYATGQFGKNHQGDRDEHLPTSHGFDEFFGNLYHLNAQEEPENEDYPKNPEFLKKFGPRGVIHSWAMPDGTQKIEDTGPLNIKRMETVDEETLAAAKDFIQRQVKAGKPFFTWWNATRMHFRTHVKAANRGISGQDEYSDGMVEHDGHVGELLKLVDDLGIANNTIVFYSTDNGPHYNTWPDAGTMPFRSEKNSNWEGAFRVPAFVRWPGHFPAGTTLNGIVSHEDWLPTLAAAAGAPDIAEKLKEGGVPREPRPGLRRVARAVHRAARAAAVQPAARPLRAGPAQLEHLQRLVPGPGLRAGADAADRGPVPHDDEGLSAEPDAGLVQPREDPEADRGRDRRQVTNSDVMPRRGASRAKRPALSAALAAFGEWDDNA